MIDRRRFASLMAGSFVVPSFSVAPSWGQTKDNGAAFYSGIGNKLTRYAVDVGKAELAGQETVTLPANIQYAWQHPSKRFFYVVSSGGGPGVLSDTNFASAFRVDLASGALAPHGEPVALPSRPIHTSVDIAGEYLLTAYNDPSSLTVHRIKADGSLGERVSQPNALDT